VTGRALTLGAATAALGLGVAVFLWKTRQIAGSIGVGAFPLDDSWIHMQFARNLAEGRGFAYNPGAPVSGSTRNDPESAAEPSTRHRSNPTDGPKPRCLPVVVFQISK